MKEEFVPLLILPDGSYAVCTTECPCDDPPELDLSLRYAPYTYFRYNGSDYLVLDPEDVKDFTK